MTFTLEANRDVLTSVDLTADACPRNSQASRVVVDWHQGLRTRPRATGCGRKHAMGPRKFHPPARRGISAGDPQVTLGETGVSPGRNVGVSSYYDPNTAQFTTPDPLFAITGERYGYAGNDPINGSDPTGMLCIVHNDNGGCKGAGTVRRVTHDVAAAPGHVAHDVNNDVVRAVGNTCVTFMSSNCDSYASSTTWGKGVLVGASAVLAVDTFVLAAGALITASGGMGLLGVGIGAVGTGVDASGCFSEHINAACTGFRLNVLATVTGLTALIGPEWLGVAALVTGGFAAEYDLAEAILNCTDS